MYDGWGGLRVKPQKKMGIIIKRGVGVWKECSCIAAFLNWLGTRATKTKTITVIATSNVTHTPKGYLCEKEIASRPLAVPLSLPPTATISNAFVFVQQ